MSNLTAAPRLAVVGGGISGLTAAYRLTQLLPRATVELYEASARLGGVLHTHNARGLLLEHGADSFLDKLPWAVGLCRELGLDGQLIPTRTGHRRAFVLHEGRLLAVPEGFVVMRPLRLLPLMRSPLLSWRGKIRVLLERWQPSPPALQQADYDESVKSFATRRLGREAFERLVQPLLAGIYTADPDRLSLAATMPEVIDDEREYGSLRLAALAKGKSAREDASGSGARYAHFVTLKDGLGGLTKALADHLPAENIHLNSPLRSLLQIEGGRWLARRVENRELGPFDGVVIATPAPRAAELLATNNAPLSKLLSQISYASSAVVSLSYHRHQISRELDGFGLVVPTVESRQIVAASFSSKKFPGRAPDDLVLIRVFLGGALQPELLDLDDLQLTELAHRELSQLLQIAGSPADNHLQRWIEKMPQYDVGHVQLVDAIDAEVTSQPGLELAGNAYHGVGIPQCIRSGNESAQRLADSLRPSS